LQAFGLIFAVIILERVNIKEFQDNAKSAIAKIMENELDG
jgi:BCD family chlorophyll transporter-like MFS transporter